jgi:AcrR family transcriptional regulator
LIEHTMRLLQTIPPADLTRLDIARAAGVDPALIRYYFGDKYKLFAEVITLIAAEIETLGSAALAGEGTPKERLARLVRANHDVHCRYPHYHQLILDQITHGRSEAVQRIRSEMSAKLREGLLDLMREGQRRGELRVVDPGHLAIAIIGMCEYFSSGWGPVAALLGESPEASRGKSAKTYGRFIEELVVRSLAP